MLVFSLCCVGGLAPASLALAQDGPGLVDAPTIVAPSHAEVHVTPPPARPLASELLRDLRLADAPLALRRARSERNLVLQLDLGRVVGQTILAEIVGAALGAGVGALAALSSCSAGAAQWLDGYGCGAGIGFGAAIGALVGAALAGPIAIARADGAWHAGGNPWLALAGAAAGIAAGSALTALLLSEWNEPSFSVLIGGVVGLVVGTAAELSFYEASRPHGAPRASRRGPRRDDVHVEPAVAPNLAGVTIRGSF